MYQDAIVATFLEKTRYQRAAEQSLDYDCLALMKMLQSKSESISEDAIL